MFNTSPAYQETIARRQPKELEAEIHQIHLQRDAAQASHNEAWFAHNVAHLAEWMISTGESLRQRYDHAAMHGEPRPRALAH
jgi:hypothetical protein